MKRTMRATQQAQEVDGVSTTDGDPMQNSGAVISRQGGPKANTKRAAIHFDSEERGSPTKKQKYRDRNRTPAAVPTTTPYKKSLKLKLGVKKPILTASEELLKLWRETAKTRESARKPFLLTLPLELQQEIFSHTSARDTARCRRVCRSLKVALSEPKRFLAKRYISQETTRLQDLVDELNPLEPPTDADSLMKVLHVWTKRRGCFASNVSPQSLAKLMAHFFVGKPEIDTVAIVSGWHDLAEDVVRMHHGFDSSDEFLDGRAAKSGLLTSSELAKLIKCVKHPELQERTRRICGKQWPPGVLEHDTFPGN